MTLTTVPAYRAIQLALSQAVHPFPLAPPQHSGLWRVFGPRCILGLLALIVLATQSPSLHGFSLLSIIRYRGGFLAVHESSVVSVLGGLRATRSKIPNRQGEPHRFLWVAGVAGAGSGAGAVGAGAGAGSGIPSLERKYIGGLVNEKVKGREGRGGGSLERESLEEERLVGQLRRWKLTSRVKFVIQHPQRLHLDAVGLGDIPDRRARREQDELEQHVPLVHMALAVCADALGGIPLPSVAEETEMQAHVRGQEELDLDVSVTVFQRRGGILAHKGVLLGAVAQAASPHVLNLLQDLIQVGLQLLFPILGRFECVTQTGSRSGPSRLPGLAAA